jgi:hypothetical protein
MFSTATSKPTLFKTMHPKTIIRLIVCIAALAALPLQAAKPAPKAEPPPVKRLLVFILAGHVGLAGRGLVDNADRVADPRILVFRGPGQWAPAVEPLHNDKRTAGVGPGLAFARALLPHLQKDVSIGLIPAAFGGTTIEQWQKDYLGDFRWPDGRTLFQQATESALAAANDGTLAGILWNQGGANRKRAQKDNGAEYRALLEKLISDFREKLGGQNLPFVAATIGPWMRAASPALTRVYLELPARVPCTAVIDTLAPEFENKLRNKPNDPSHYDAASARLLGQAYAKAMLFLIQSHPCDKQPDTGAPAKK